MRVYAPASTSNLGPGFDCLGAALSIGVTLELTDGDGWEFHHTGPGAPAEEPDGSLVREAFKAAAGRDPDGKLVMRSAMPVGAGLGSSGAAIAAGLRLGDAWAEAGRTLNELAELAIELEGHPDNVAASIFGGLVVCVPTSTGWRILRFDPSPSVRPLIVLSGEELATTAARGALPDKVDRGVAIGNLSRTAGLVAVMTGAADADPQLLSDVTVDGLHEPFRSGMMPRTAEAQGALREAGVAAVVSGAGPSILCLCCDGVDAASVVADLDGWEPLELDWDLEGSRLIGD